MKTRKGFNYIQVNAEHFQFRVGKNYITIYRPESNKKITATCKEIFGQTDIYRFKDYFFREHIEFIIKVKTSGIGNVKWEMIKFALQK